MANDEQDYMHIDTEVNDWTQTPLDLVTTLAICIVIIVVSIIKNKFRKF
jgi:hypothetical protein